MTDHDPRPPTVADASRLVEVADSVWVLPDHERTPHVPNVGFVVGERAALVVDSGIGIENGRRVLAIARELAGERPLFLTSTHFHPEHALGAGAFQGAATIVCNVAQREEAAEKGRRYIEKFSGFTAALAAALEGAEPTAPDLVYGDLCELDLGGCTVRLLHFGGAHTRGDQIVHVLEAATVFTGDLVEERFFTIMDDADAHGDAWIERLEAIEALDPTVVVPGHGDLGGPELIATVRGSLEAMRDRVAELAARDATAEEIVAAVEPEILDRYPDWGNREWVGAALRNLHGGCGQVELERRELA